MTPKLKARELIAKHFQIVAKSAGRKGLKTSADTHVFDKLETLSIKLAILTVEEIIQYEDMILVEFPSETFTPNYWHEVKNELIIFKYTALFLGLCITPIYPQ